MIAYVKKNQQYNFAHFSALTSNRKCNIEKVLYVIIFFSIMSNIFFTLTKYATHNIPVIYNQNKLKCIVTVMKLYTIHNANHDFI